MEAFHQLIKTMENIGLTSYYLKMAENNNYLFGSEMPTLVTAIKDIRASEVIQTGLLSEIKSTMALKLKTRNLLSVLSTNKEFARDLPPQLIERCIGFSLEMLYYGNRSEMVLLEMLEEVTQFRRLVKLTEEGDLV